MTLNRFMAASDRGLAKDMLACIESALNSLEVPRVAKHLPELSERVETVCARLERLTRSLPPAPPIATGTSRGDAEDVSPRPFQEAEAEYTPYWRDL